MQLNHVANRLAPEHFDTDKLRSQIAFLSETPAKAVAAYSDREFYLDTPDAFVADYPL